MSKQANIVPDKAATIVVHPIAGVGDATTIADGVAMLPSVGGNILLREGTFSPSTTVTMPDAPVRIMGSGDNTHIDLGSNAIAIFTIPDGLTSTHAYVFEDFRVTGNSAADQKIVDVQDTNARGKVSINRVNTGDLLDTTKGVRGGVFVTSGDTNFETPVFIEVNDSWWVPVSALLFAPPTYHASYLVSDGGSGYIIQATFKKFNYFVKLPISGFYNGEMIGGSFADFSFGSIDFSFYDSNLAITVATNGGGTRFADDGIGSINAVNTSIFNWGEFGQMEIDVIPFGFVDEIINLTNCEVHGMFFVLAADSASITGGTFFDTAVTLTSGSPGSDSVTGATFRFDNSQNTEGTMIEVKGVQTLIDGCIFNPGTDVDQIIKIFTGNTSVAHCQFGGIVSGGTHVAGITIGTGSTTGRDNFIHDNYFSSSFTVPPILENATADRNRYANNEFVSTTAPTFFGKNNVFNDVTQASTTGTTTASLVAQFTHVNPNGIIGIGTIKNTDVTNSMDVKITATDLFGVTGSHTKTVTQSTSYVLNPISPVDALTTGGSPLPPFISYKVEVTDTVGGNHTTFELHHANLGVQ